MGFSQWWVHLVLRCVSIVSYPIVHYEHEIGLIKPARGIRQGDPIYPYLFIISVEGLSPLLRKYETKQWIRRIKICRKTPMVTHILFADYSYFFCKTDTNEAMKVLELLEVYEKVSGQWVNKSKSSIFFSTIVIQYNRQLICQALQMMEADGHSKYLGLLNIIGRNKSAILGFLKDKVHMKIRSWDGIFISRAG